MLRPRCSDILEIETLQNIKAASILLHGDPDDKFQLESEEFIFRRHILTCYVGKYSMLCDVLDISTSLLCAVFERLN